MIIPKNGHFVLVIFWRFLNFGLFFVPFLGTKVKKANHKKVAPGICPGMVSA